MWYVYRLVDPKNGKVRYVGLSNKLKTRLQLHIRESLERQNTEKKRWIYKLWQKGLRPILLVVASCDTEDEARRAESTDWHLNRATVFNIHNPGKDSGIIMKRGTHAN